jgi:hypothetical protein
LSDGAGDVERTDDGRYVVVDGRRWRATDPGIPDALATELRRALMSGRRAVGAARRAGDDAATVAARAVVHDAKVALGERGQAWWEPAEPEARRARIVAAVRTLSRARHPGSTCPSDIARAVGGEQWRRLMPEVREVAFELADDGVVRVTQRGEAVAADARGPLRIVAIVDDRPLA